MQNDKLKFKYIFVILILLNTLVFYSLFRQDDKLHLVFCDVGQGDGILIYKKNVQIVVDGGPDRSILSCLGKHMQFFDRTIEYVILTNSDLDHYGGLIDIFERYKVLGFGTSGVEKEDSAYVELRARIEGEKVEVRNIYLGNRINIENIGINIFWPKEILVDGNVNEQSIVLELIYGNFNALLTGDVVPPSTDVVAELILGQKERGLKSATTVLKVPHHGSKNGLTAKMLEATQPKLAVISAGKNNRYGHPHQEVLDLLKNIKTIRTDVSGEIEIITDGNRWWLR